MESLNGIEIIDHRQLLNKYIEQGFSLEALSKVTGISTDALGKFSTQSISAVNDLSENDLIYLHVFLTQLYCVSPQDSEYLCSLVDGLVEYFHISRNAVANYIGLPVEELDKFLVSPEKFDDGEKYTTRIMHLFTTFARDMRFSVQQ